MQCGMRTPSSSSHHHSTHQLTNIPSDLTPPSCNACDDASAAVAAVHAGAAAVKLRAASFVIAKLNSKLSVPAGFPLGPWPTPEHAKMDISSWAQDFSKAPGGFTIKENGIRAAQKSVGEKRRFQCKQCSTQRMGYGWGCEVGRVQEGWAISQINASHLPHDFFSSMTDLRSHSRSSAQKNLYKKTGGE